MGANVALLHLRPAGQPRAHEVPVRIVGNRLGEGVDHRHLLGARADQAHIARQHVPQLRQLVQPVLADHAAHACDAGILARREARGGVGLDAHAAKLEHREHLAEAADARLPEQHRPRLFEADGQRGQRRQRQGERHEAQRGCDVDQTLHEAIEIVPRVVVQEVLVDMVEPHAAGEHFANPLHRIQANVAHLQSRQRARALGVGGARAVKHQAVAKHGILDRTDEIEADRCRRGGARHGEDRLELLQRAGVRVADHRHIVLHEAPVADAAPDQRGEVAEQQRAARILDMPAGKDEQQQRKRQRGRDADQTVALDRRQVQRAVQQQERAQVGHDAPEQRTREDVGDDARVVQGLRRDRVEPEQREPERGP
ncbi:hypothetical protein D3C81_1261070 [compost metagenome]